jgi:hypothetical protein
MAHCAIQLQKARSLPDFQRIYGAEEQCEPGPIFPLSPLQWS